MTLKIQNNIFLTEEESSVTQGYKLHLPSYTSLVSDLFHLAQERGISYAESLSGDAEDKFT